MRCPSCKANDTKVIDSRATEGGAVIRRRRMCLSCKRRFTTKERTEAAMAPKTSSSGRVPGPMVGVSEGRVIDSLGYPGSGPVVGVRFDWHAGGDTMAFHVFTPVFEGDRQFVAGAQDVVCAADGYALGALLVDATDSVHAVQLIFMRVGDDGQLDPEDSYASDWLGQPSGAAPVELNGKGRQVIGFHARQAPVLVAIGLIHE